MVTGLSPVALCRFINGMKAQGTPLKDARVVFYGAGSSAVGVATMIAQLLVKEEGLTFDQAKQVPSFLRPWHLHEWLLGCPARRPSRCRRFPGAWGTGPA